MPSKTTDTYRSKRHPRGRNQPTRARDASPFVSPLHRRRRVVSFPTSTHRSFASSARALEIVAKIATIANAMRITRRRSFAKCRRARSRRAHASGIRTVTTHRAPFHRHSIARSSTNMRSTTTNARATSGVTHFASSDAFARARRRRRHPSSSSSVHSTRSIAGVPVVRALSIDLLPSTTTTDDVAQWQLYCGFIAGVAPFAIAAIEFGKRIAIQRACARCRGSGLIEININGDRSRGTRKIKCTTCGGFLPWESWERFFTSEVGNGGVVRAPRGQTSVFYDVERAKEYGERDAKSDGDDE